MQHIDKIFKLHNILLDRRTPITGKALQEKLECSRATRDRIIKYMREMLDAPIVYDKNRNGFYYDQDHAQHPYELPGLWFNAQELQALLACQHLLANVSAGILQDDIAQLQSRLERLLRLNDHRELLMDILKHGAEVEVVAPAFLIQAVREQLAGMQKIYSGE